MSREKRGERLVPEGEEEGNMESSFLKDVCHTLGQGNDSCPRRRRGHSSGSQGNKAHLHTHSVPPNANVSSHDDYILALFRGGFVVVEPVAINRKS